MGEACETAEFGRRPVPSPESVKDYPFAVSRNPVILLNTGRAGV
jgi:hypothetical protein